MKPKDHSYKDLECSRKLAVKVNTFNFKGINKLWLVLYIISFKGTAKIASLWARDVAQDQIDLEQYQNRIS